MSVSRGDPETVWRWRLSVCGAFTAAHTELRPGLGTTQTSGLHQLCSRETSAAATTAGTSHILLKLTLLCYFKHS